MNLLTTSLERLFVKQINITQTGVENSGSTIYSVASKAVNIFKTNNACHVVLFNRFNSLS